MNGSGDRFPGFPRAAMTFLADLKANNDRAWFAAHREVYDAAIRRPAAALIEALRPELEAMSDEALSPKIFRIHRDVRFSKDKSPFNAHLHISFVPGADGAARSSAAPGFYFGLEPDRLHLGAGAFGFQGEALDRFRAAVAEDTDGALPKLMRSLADAGFTSAEPELKRVPAPYPADHPRGELLRRKGLTAWRVVTDRQVIESPALVAEAMAAFSQLSPMNRWISEAIA